MNPVLTNLTNAEIIGMTDAEFIAALSPAPSPADAERWHAYALAALASKNSDPITAADLLLAAFKSRFPAA